MNSHKKIIIFEKTSFLTALFMKFFVGRGYDVRTFDLPAAIKKNRLLRPLFDEGKIVAIYANSYEKAHGDAIDLIEEVFPQLKDNKYIDILRKLYGSENTDQLFKKGLVEELFMFCFIQNYLLNLEEQNPTCAGIYFVPCQYALNKAFLKKANIPVHDRYENFKSVKIISNLSGYWDDLGKSFVYRLAMAAYVVPKVLACLGGRLLRKPEVVSQSRPFGIIIGSRIEVEQVGDRGYAFLIDQKDFTTENILFIDVSGLEASLIARERSRGRNIIKIKDQLKPSVLKENSWKLDFLRPLLTCLRESLFSKSPRSVFAKVMFIGQQRFLDWNILLQKIDFKALIYTNQENIQMSAINIILRQRGKSTWNYSCFLGGGYLKAKNKDWPSVRNIHWSYLVYDHFAGVNQDVIEYYQIHHQNVRSYNALGSFYSQLIAEKTGPSFRAQFIQKYFPNVSDFSKKKLIAVFDTAFVDTPECLTNYEDCLFFYEDMQRLLNEYPEYLLFFKPSKSPAFYGNPDHPWSSPVKGAKIIELWKSLEKHPRVYLTSGTKITQHGFLNFSINNELMAASDIVITHCMSSTTGEALGARKKAFWYESRMRHTDFDYENIPGLIVHGYPALTNRIHELLYETSDEQYTVYLDRYVKGKVEQNLDGRALTRFKDRLMGAYG